jgi:hypothetical protein
MKLLQFTRQMVILSLTCQITACAFAQNKSTETFEPVVGQRGKDVIWVPTPQELVDTMLDMAKVTPSDYLIDLGSGDGRTVITAAKRGVRALGIEYNPDMVALSQRNAAAAGVSDKATFRQADLFTSDFSEATVITMFLLNSINLKLRPILLELKPGTRIVSNTFDMGEWKPDETASTGTRDDETFLYNTALLWIVPAKVGGIWKIDSGELSLTQEFQMLSGTYTAGNKTVAIERGKMNGSEITFIAGDTQYTGLVKGDTIEGTYTSGGNNRTWRATRVRNQ